MNELYIAQRTKKKLARQYGIGKISIALDCMANKGNDAFFSENVFKGDNHVMKR